MTHVFRVGDLVDVLPIGEIYSTLDARGELEHVPFMPEMVQYCGRRLEVSAVLTKTCSGGLGMREVAGEPLLLLDRLRCGGEFHGRCSRACTLFWKPQWLRPADSSQRYTNANIVPSDWPYPTEESDGTLSCQVTALSQATVPLAVSAKALSAVADLRGHEWSASTMVTTYLQTIRSRLRKTLLKVSARYLRPRERTPSEGLDLKPGEWVRVKTMKEISETLDRNGRNRGLEFSRYMTPYCGGTYQVLARMENFIDERTGELRRLRDTVLLDGVVCGGETTSGLCRRAEYLYWREIWLQRTAIDASDEA